MSSLAIPSAAQSQSRSYLRLDLLAIALPLGALWFVLGRHLAGEWSINEQYSYGWFVPFFAAYLFWLRWEDRPEPESRKEKVEGRKQIGFLISTSAFLLLFLLLPIRVFEIGDPDWRPMSWLHTAIVVGLTLILMGSFGGRRWVRHFAFPVCFIFVAVPWVSLIEEPIVQGLMRLVAAVAAETLTLFGIPTQLEGNLIRVSTGLVGVNEACSGVRSLQTSIMIGLLFGELKRLTSWRRLGLIGGAIAIALLANFVRTFALVWVAATRGLAQSQRWHDLAGYAIVAIVFAGTMLLASRLARSKVESRKAKVENPTSAAAPLNSNSSFLLPNFYFGGAILTWVLLVEFAAVAWYRAHETNVAPTARWDIRWPESAPGFRDLKIDETIKGALRFDTGREVVWHGKDAREGTTNLFYFFRWEPGTSTILRARAHRPDICLPSAGWRQTEDAGIRAYPVGPDLAIPFRHFAFAHEPTMQSGPAFAHAFFCLYEDVIRRGEASQLDVSRPGAWSLPDRWRVVRNGIRNPGQQVAELIMVSGREHSAAEAQEWFAGMVPELIKVETKH